MQQAAQWREDALAQNAAPVGELDDVCGMASLSRGSWRVLCDKDKLYDYHFQNDTLVYGLMMIPIKCLWDVPDGMYRLSWTSPGGRGSRIFIYRKRSIAEPSAPPAGSASA